MQVDNLRKRCVWHVARELARPAAAKGATSDEQLTIWGIETRINLGKATEVINSMSNLELLDLLSVVLNDA